MSFFTWVVRPLGNLLSVIMYESRNRDAKPPVEPKVEPDDRLVKTPMSHELQELIQAAEDREVDYLIHVVDDLHDFCQNVLIEEGLQDLVVKTVFGESMLLSSCGPIPIPTVMIKNKQNEAIVLVMGVLSGSRFIFAEVANSVFREVNLELYEFKMFSRYEVARLARQALLRT